MVTFAPIPWGATSGPWPDDDPEKYVAKCPPSEALRITFPGHAYDAGDFRTLVAALRKHEPKNIWMQGGGSEWEMDIGYSKAHGSLVCLYFEEIKETRSGASLPDGDSLSDGGSVISHSWVRLRLDNGMFDTGTGSQSRTLPKPFTDLPQGPSPKDA